MKAYTGVSQVKGSMVYPKDDTWFKNWHADDKGNPVIEQGVRIVNNVVNLEENLLTLIYTFRSHLSVFMLAGL